MFRFRPFSPVSLDGRQTIKLRIYTSIFDPLNFKSGSLYERKFISNLWFQIFSAQQQHFGGAYLQQ